MLMTPGARFKERFTAALVHTYDGTVEDQDVRYVVREGTFPAELGGVLYTTVFPRQSLTARGEMVAAPHLLTAPGRMLVVSLDASRPAGSDEWRLFTRTLQNDAWHLRAIAPQAFVRSDFAEMSWFGISNLTNTTPVPMFPSPPGEDGRAGVRMLLSYDAGRPIEVNPQTLHVKTPIGTVDDYHAAVGSLFSPMAMTTGHPVYDPEFESGAPRLLYTNLVPRVATMLTVDSPIAADLYVVTWTGEGRPTPPMRVCVDGVPVVMTQASAHQLCVTRDHLVIVQSSLVLDVASLARPLAPYLQKWLDGNVAPPLRAPLEWLQGKLMQRLHPAAQPPETTLFVIGKRELRRALAEGPGARVDAKKLVLPWESSHALADYDSTPDVLTLFSQHNVGADAAQPLADDDVLLDRSTADPRLKGMFSASTDLNQVRKHVIHLPTSSVTPTAFPDPGSEADFPFGLNLLPPLDIHPYRPAGGDYDLLGCTATWERTFWVAAGWTPATESKRVFDMYEAARPEGQRLLPSDEYLRRSRAPENTVRLFALDRDLHRVDEHVLEEGVMIGSPAFVPRKGSRSVTDGFLVALAWTADEKHMEVWVYDLQRKLSAGPVCKLGPKDADNAMSPGFPLHTSWIDRASVDAWQEGPYRVSAVQVPKILAAAELVTVAASAISRLIAQSVESAVASLSTLRR